MFTKKTFFKKEKIKEAYILQRSKLEKHPDTQISHCLGGRGGEYPPENKIHPCPFP